MAVRPYEPLADVAQEYCFLAQACIAAGAYAKAIEFAEAGLELVPTDAALIGTRGDASRACTTTRAPTPTGCSLSSSGCAT